MEIRHFIETDVMIMAENMCEADRRTAYNAFRLSPLDALTRSVTNSSMVYTVTIDDRAVALLGIVPRPHAALMWFVSSDTIENKPISIVRLSRKVIKEFLNLYTQLDNYVKCDNLKMINWLTWLGAKFDEPEPYGIDRELFQRFVIRR